MDRPGGHWCNSETKPRLGKEDPTDGLSDKSLRSSRTPNPTERKRRRHEVSALQSDPYVSDEERGQKLDDCTSSQRQQSSRPEKGKNEVFYP
ncbi:hypothetical protein IscW_ISCW011766 [Ixodes scapularis]|uniref:Uncharacterized protein n=1 Tax=Ixodes scapularis TaxID=6945 RepID=B7Q7R5_IXOSC|nr:hypothetical protein IscW_ISCW011766 [Ixodes scapularis]|eukprot:XP_002412197.1 hypothetical protein IscW_ISCW011766 [Ixodes scapularis]